MQYTVIDVREPDEFQSSHVHGAINIPHDQLMSGAKQLSDLPKDSYIIVYCRTGTRSTTAMNTLNTLGYTNVTNGINKEKVEAEFGIS